MRITGSEAFGEEGIVDLVHDGIDRLSAMEPREARMFVKAKKASHGADWIDKWSEVHVTLDSGRRIVTEGRSVEVLDGLIRPEGYRRV